MRLNVQYDVEKHRGTMVVEAERCCCVQEAKRLLEEQLPTASQEDQNSWHISRKVCGAQACTGCSETLLSFLRQHSWKQISQNKRRGRFVEATCKTRAVEVRERGLLARGN